MIADDPLVRAREVHKARVRQLTEAGACPLMLDSMTPVQVWELWKARRREPEVWCISEVTGRLTQMPRTEADRRGLHHADTPDALDRSLDPVRDWVYVDPIPGF